MLGVRALAVQPKLTDAIIGRTSQDIVDKVYDTLEVLDGGLRSADIGYTIFGGTVLGAVRHGGLIPWDDDADIVIKSGDADRLRALKDGYAKQGYELTETYFGFRLSDENGIRGEDGARRPFVDVFVIDDDGAQYVYPNEKSRAYWPQNPLPYGCLERTEDVRFGGLTLRGMSAAESMQHLDENYGASWPNTAYKEWDHINHCEVKKQEVEIVDFSPARRSAR